MYITKKEIIQKLYDISENEGIKLGREVQRVIRNEIIPLDIIKLINKYDNKFLKIYDTYNVIYQSRNKNPLYRNLRNKNLSVEEKAIALSSLVTKILISCSKIKELQDRLIFSKAMDIEGICNAICIYSTTGNDTQLINYFNEVNELLQLLYNE